LFAAVLTSFLIDSLQNLQPDPAQQSLYYHQQSVAMLAQISQQIASIAPHVSVPSGPPPPYPSFHPSAADIRVNAYWLVGLVCSLSAALFATLVQQWVRSYLKVFQRYNQPLKRARFRQFFFEGAGSMRAMAVAVPSLIRVSLFLFFLGLGDSMVGVNRIIGVITIIPICCSGSFFLYGMLTPNLNLQSPRRTVFSWPIFLIQNFWRPHFGNRIHSKKLMTMSIEACQEWLVMEETDGRKDRDMRAVRWLIDSTAVNAEMEPLVLAIPGSFNTKWGRDVWRETLSQTRDTLEPLTSPSPVGSQVSLISHPPHLLEGTVIDTISQFFETRNNHSSFESEDARRRRMRACVEAAASLVCCLDYRLELFGEIAKLISELGRMEEISAPLTNRSDLLFTMRRTCLSLMAAQQMLSSNQVQVFANHAVSEISRLRPNPGPPNLGQLDEAALDSAQWIDERLKMAWECAEDLSRAFEPWGRTKTTEQVQEILRNRETQISLLKIEANGKEFDKRVSLLQDGIDIIGHGLMRLLPSVTFSELQHSGPFPTSEIFNFEPAGTTPTPPITPQFIYPGRQVQALARLNLQLRNILEGRDTGIHLLESLESLKSIDTVPIPLRRSNGLMTRQLWRLQDLRDGAGLGLTIELFFLSLRQPLSASSSQGPDRVFYTETFRKIASNWMASRESLGTQNILLNIICDLVIRGRGIFSDFAYPDYVVTMLLEMVGNMLREHRGPYSHIDAAMREIKGVNTTKCVGLSLRHKAWDTMVQSWNHRYS
jgi:hypothetical protein